MKCTSCHTFVTKIPVNWKCPRCGEKLPEPTKLYYFREYMSDYLQDKGMIFWSVWYGIFILFVGAMEILFSGEARLLSYVGNGLVMAFFGFFYTGMLIDMIMKINLPLRSMSGQDFILKERKVIRNIRKVTNVTILAGLFTCFYWLGPRTFLEYFPSYSIVMSWYLAMGWAITGLLLDPRMNEDVRFRLYMERLGVISLKQFRKIGTACIGLLVVVVIGFHVLSGVSGLWTKLYNLGFVGVVIRFFKEYFGWFF